MIRERLIPIINTESASKELLGEWNSVLDRVCSTLLLRPLTREDAPRFQLIRTNDDPFQILLKFDGEEIGYITQTFVKRDESWFFNIDFKLVGQ